MHEQLTKRQKKVLDFVTNIIELRGEPPPMREIAEGLGLNSSSNIHRILGDLERKGYLHLKRSTQRVLMKSSLGKPNRPALTYREGKVFDFVFKRIGESGVSPSYREIKEDLQDISLGNIYKILQSLQEKGYIGISPGQTHFISLVAPDDDAVYPIPFQIVPCYAKYFLSPSKADAWVENIQLLKIIPNFKKPMLHLCLVWF